MRVAVVAYRFARSPEDGLERLCRRVTERLARFHDVEVLTAEDEGARGDEGVPVRRFAVEGQREPAGYEDARDRILLGSLSEEEERELMRAGGPYCPELLRYLEGEARAKFDAFVFFGYRSHTTFAGLPAVGRRAIFVPGAADEPLLYMRSMDEVFRATPFLVFHSPEEQALAARRFNLDAGIGRVVKPALDGDGWRRGFGEEEWIERAAGRPIVAYAGGSGDAGELAAYFERYAAEPGRPEAFLPLPGEEGVESEALLAVADVAVAPSPDDWVALGALDAMQRGIPVLANGRCASVVGHCVRSNGGLWYRNYAEFADALEVLLARPDLRAALGQAGAAYVERSLPGEEWDEVYLKTLERIARGSADA